MTKHTFIRSVVLALMGLCSLQAQAESDCRYSLVQGKVTAPTSLECARLELGNGCYNHQQVEGILRNDCATPLRLVATPEVQCGRSPASTSSCDVSLARGETLELFDTLGLSPPGAFERTYVLERDGKQDSVKVEFEVRLNETGSSCAASGATSLALPALLMVMAAATRARRRGLTQSPVS